MRPAPVVGLVVRTGRVRAGVSQLCLVVLVLLNELEQLFAVSFDRVGAYASHLEQGFERARPPDVARAVDRDAPESLLVPSGRHVRLDYLEDGTVSATVKLQEVFGLAETPRIGPRREPVLLARTRFGWFMALLLSILATPRLHLYQFSSLFAIRRVPTTSRDD